MKRWVTALVMGPALATTLPAFAQPALQTQSPGDPGYVETAIEGALPEIDTSALPEGSSGPLGASGELYVADVRVEGVTILDESVVDRVTAAVEGRTVGLEALNDVRLELTRLYVEAGYVNSGVVIPDQNVQDNVIVMRAIEGELSGVEISGTAYTSPEYLESRLGAMRGPLNVFELQNSLARLQRDPLILRLDAVLAPGDELGESVLRLALDEPKRFEVGLTGDNYMPVSLGEERGRVFLRSQNLTGYGEVLRFGANVADGADSLDVSLSVPMGWRETRATVYYSGGDSKIVEDRFNALNIESQTETFGILFSQPVWENVNESVALSLGFEKKHSESTLDDTPFRFAPGDDVNGEADVSVVLLGAEYVRRSPASVLNLRTTFRKGIDAFDATLESPFILDPNVNSSAINGEFNMFFTQLLYLHRLNDFSLLSMLNDRAQLQIRSTWQEALDPLLAIEKTPVGGVNTVRGYEENLLIRDNAFNASLEFQLPIPGYRADPHPRNLVFAPFVDFGSAWDQRAAFNQIPNVDDTSNARIIVGVGAGLIWQPFAGVDARVFYGEDVLDNFNKRQALTDENDEGAWQRDGVHFSLTYRLNF